jgi:hypothetical protein
MTQWIHALIYCLIGLVGAYGHYLKKRYKDNTTTDSLHDYCFENFPHTLWAVFGIFGSELILAAAGVPGSEIGLDNIMAAWAVGFANDSVINKASDAAP